MIAVSALPGSKLLWVVEISCPEMMGTLLQKLPEISWLLATFVKRVLRSKSIRMKKMSVKNRRENNVQFWYKTGDFQ